MGVVSHTPIKTKEGVMIETIAFMAGVVVGMVILGELLEGGKAYKVILINGNFEAKRLS
jgi:hypothetical protein